MKPKKKLLVFASTFPRWKNDTIPPFVYELSKRLTSDFEVHVLAPHFPGSKKYEVMDKMKVHRFRYFFKRYERLAGEGGILPTLKKNKLYFAVIPFFLAAEYFALKRLVKEIKPDVIHAHWIIPQGFIAALVKKRTGVPFVVTTHGGDIWAFKGKMMRSLKRFTLRNAKKTTVVSTAIRDEIHKAIDSNLEISVISMGVDSTKFNPKNKNPAIRKKYGINGPFLLFVGRLAEKKGVKYLIEAMPEVLKKSKDAKLLIVGTGTLESELKQLTKSLKLENSIIFTGAIPNAQLPEYYASADLFIAPSIEAKSGDKEGLPVTLMEAASSGSVIIATDLAGNKDLIQDKTNGFLVRQEDSREISQAISAALLSGSKLSNLKKNSRTKAVSKFDWKVISSRYSEVLKR